MKRITAHAADPVWVSWMNITWNIPFGFVTADAVGCMKYSRQPVRRGMKRTRTTCMQGVH